MTIINAFASDPDVAKFLETIGLPEAVRRKPILTPEGLAIHHVDYGSLSAVASSERLCGYDTSMAEVLNPVEARQALELIARHGKKVQTLFDSSTCPGMGTASQTVLNNFLDRDRSRMLFVGVTDYEMACSIDTFAQYSPEQLLGVHFVDATAGFLRSYGAAVVPITEADDAGHCSAVLVQDPTGMGQIALWSAEHCVHRLLFGYPYNAQPFFAKIGTQRVSITADMLRHFDPILDSVRVDGVTTSQPGLRPAAHPPLPGEPVWMIGYPQNAYGPQALRTFTPGTVTGYSSDDQLVVAVRGWYGNSGGAIVNARGDVVAITAMFTNAKGGLASPLLAPQDRLPSHMAGPMLTEYFTPVEQLLWSAVTQAYEEVGLASYFRMPVASTPTFADMYVQVRHRVECEAPGIFDTSASMSVDAAVVVTNVVEEAKTHLQPSPQVADGYDHDHRPVPQMSPLLQHSLRLLNALEPLPRQEFDPVPLRNLRELYGGQLY